MARTRNIKPQFFSNEDLAAVPALGRLLFIGLWTVADRDGRLEDRPQRIKVEILPYDDCSVDDLLAMLADKQFIMRYSVESKRFIQILTFSKHQNPHMKEAPSTIPAPAQHQPRQLPVREIPERASTKNSASTGNSGTSRAFHPSTLSALNGLPESGVSQNWNEWDPESAFRELLAAYPPHRRDGSRLAQDNYIAATGGTEERHRKLMGLLARSAESDQWNTDGGKFVPGMARWLSSPPWHLEIEEPKRYETLEEIQARVLAK